MPMIEPLLATFALRLGMAQHLQPENTRLLESCSSFALILSALGSY